MKQQLFGLTSDINIEIDRAAYLDAELRSVQQVTEKRMIRVRYRKRLKNTR